MSGGVIRFGRSFSQRSPTSCSWIAAAQRLCRPSIIPKAGLLYTKGSVAVSTISRLTVGVSTSTPVNVLEAGQVGKNASTRWLSAKSTSS